MRASLRLLAIPALALGLVADASAGGQRREFEAGLRGIADGMGAAAALLVQGEPAGDDPAIEAVLLQAADDAQDNLTAARHVRPKAAGDRLRVRMEAVRRRISRALRELREGAGDAAMADELAACAQAVNRLRRDVRSQEELVVLQTGRGPVTLHRPGTTVVLRAGPCEGVTVTLRNADPLERAVEEELESLGNGRFRVTLGPDAGSATFEARGCDDAPTRTWTLVNVGPPDALATAAPSGFSYPATQAVRVDEPVSLLPTIAGDAATITVAPELPDGLALDPATGAITGAPTAESPLTVFTVVARNARGAASAQVALEVGSALPEGVTSLEPGFSMRKVIDADTPVRMALAEDGRVFYCELLSGNVRVLGADEVLQAAVFANLQVKIGGERGLLGIALAPDFATSGHVFVCGTVDAGGGHPERAQVVRFTEAGGAGTDPVLVVDDLPVGASQNGGAVEFGPDGMLYVTVGDTGDALLAQADGSRAGRVLRFTPDGAVPADNPIAGDPEWVRGFRNPFDLTFHPVTGGMFVSENGPTAHDELDFVQRGKNYEWGAEPESIPGPFIGRRLIDWTPVIVPTGIVFHDGTGFGAEFADDLFVAGYDRADVRRLVLSGTQFTDLDEERGFLQFEESSFEHKPLDLQRGADGSLWISTFSAIWKVTRP